MNPSTDSPETRIALFQRKRDPLQADACKGGANCPPPFALPFETEGFIQSIPSPKKLKTG